MSNFDFLLFCPRVSRIRADASAIASSSSALKGLTAMNRVDLRKSAEELRATADKLDKLSTDEERDRLMGCFEMGDLSEREFTRAMRHLGIDESEIEAFIAQFETDEAGADQC